MVRKCNHDVSSSYGIVVPSCISSTMDAHSLSKTNAFLNLFSGNCFPLKSVDERRSIGVKIYIAFTWIMVLIFFLSLVIVTRYVPIEVTIEKCTFGLVINMEDLILASWLTAKTNLLRRLMMEMSEIRLDNVMLKKAISQALDSMNRPIKIYAACTVAAAILWDAMAFLKLLLHEQFTYTDFVVPTYFPGEPFDRTSFAIGATIQSIGIVYAVTKKTAIDVYIIHIVVTLTSHYKYLRDDLADILSDEENHSGILTMEDEHQDTKLKKRLDTWIKHHQAVLKISRTLSDVTSMYALVIYIISTFRFSLLAYTAIKVSLELSEKSSICCYVGGNLMQLYMLCNCVQELFDLGSSVTTKAFHGEWYRRSESTKKVFKAIMIADGFGIRLSAFGIVDLSLETFMQIISNAYSVCLFLQNVD